MGEGDAPIARGPRPWPRCGARPAASWAASRRSRGSAPRRSGATFASRSAMLVVDLGDPAMPSAELSSGLAKRGTPSRRARSPTASRKPRGPCGLTPHCRTASVPACAASRRAGGREQRSEPVGRLVRGRHLSLRDRRAVEPLASRLPERGRRARHRAGLEPGSDQRIRNQSRAAERIRGRGVETRHVMELVARNDRGVYALLR